MRKPSRLILFVSLVASLPGQRELHVGPFGPEDASSVVHVDVAAIRATILGKAIEESRLGRAGARWFAHVAGYPWTELSSLRLASVARPEHTRLRGIWVLHARGGKGLGMPQRLALLGVDPLTAGAGTAELGFVSPGPGELVVGEARFLRDRLRGVRPEPTPPAGDLAPAYLLYAEILLPDVGVARVGGFTVPLLDGVSYRADPPKKITVCLARDRGGVLQLVAEIRFASGNSSAWSIARSLEERIARAQRDGACFHLWPAIRALRTHAFAHDALRITLSLPDARVLEAALGGYAHFAARVESMTNQGEAAETAAAKPTRGVEVAEIEEEEDKGAGRRR